MTSDNIVISLGGSLIVQEEIDTEFIKEFRDVILEEVAKGRKFVITCGGGKICRTYQAVASELTKTSKEDLDWIGIASLKLNAELIRIVFGKYAHQKVIENLSEPFTSDKPIIIGSAYKPGHSTDMGAVFAAKTIGAKIIINLSNIAHVYDSDPDQNKNAKKYDKISWAEYRDIIPKEWTPGLSTPFDPIASKEAQNEALEVLIMNGKPTKNLKNYLGGNGFEGTIIS